MSEQLSRLSINPRMSAGQFASLFSEGEETALNRLSTAQVRTMRAAAFHESPIAALKRGFLSFILDMRRDGLKGVSQAVDLLLRERSIAADGLPVAEDALSCPEGLAGIARNLRLDATMTAYSRGLYLAPYCGAPCWWAPSTRAVALVRDMAAEAPNDLKVICDRDFHRMFDDCEGEPTPPRMKWALCRLHDSGFAHNFEIFDAFGLRWAWGCGVAVGDVFVISVMQFAADSCRRIALQALARQLRKLKFDLLDCGACTSKMEALGFRPMTRAAYTERLAAGLKYEKIGFWREEAKTRPLIPLAA